MFNASLLVHIRKVTDFVKNVGARIELNFDNFNLEITGSGKYFVFTAEFIEPRDGYMIYQPVITPETTAFSGWRLSPRREYVLSTDKSAFKKFCVRNKLRTPATVKPQDGIDEAVVVKEIIRSGARGVIAGPMQPQEVARDTSADRGFFLEQFVEGDSIVAWYWDGKLACVEHRARPSVKGDGVSTLRQLVESRGIGSVTDSANNRYGTIDWPRIEAMARRQGIGLDEIVLLGSQIVLDFNFRSSLNPIPRVSENIVEQLTGTIVHDQLSHAGPIFWSGLQEQNKSSALFCVSAVIDDKQQVWFTDMDLGQYVHPDVYATIISSLFGIQVLSGMPQSAVVPTGISSVIQH